MWSVGRYDFGLSDSEFWALTLAEYDALGKRAKARARRDAMGAAQISCILANVNRDPKKRPQPYKLDDFLPGEPERVEAKAPQTVEQMIFAAKAITIGLGGRIVKKE